MTIKYCIAFTLILHVLILPFQEEETEKKLKILFVVRVFPHATQTFINNQLKGLLDRGHDVYILADREVCQETPLSLASYNPLDRTFYKTLPEDQNDFDIIFCQLAGLAQHCIELKRAGLRGQLVVSFRDESQIKRYREDLHKEIFQESSLLMPVCDYLRDRLIRFGCDPNKAIVHHSSIDCSKFKFKSRFLHDGDTIIIISTNRLVEQKGTKYAIKAVAKLLKKYNNIEYLIIGEGELHHELENLISRLKVQGKIKLLGKKSHEDVAALLDTGHIFLLPSITSHDGKIEGIPNALKEAMAMGLPVVSTYHSGIPELVEDGVFGFLVPERDVDALADKLEYLITHPEVWAEMGAIGHQKIEHEYDMEKENDKLVKILQELVA